MPAAPSLSRGRHEAKPRVKKEPPSNLRIKEALARAPTCLPEKIGDDNLKDPRRRAKRAFVGALSRRGVRQAGRRQL